MMVVFFKLAAAPDRLCVFSPSNGGVLVWADT